MGWCLALPAEGADGEGVVSLGEAAAVGVGDEGAVVPVGRCPAEALVEEELAGGGDEEVVASDDFSDAHEVVVDDDGELVGGDVVAPPDEEVAEVASGEEGLGAVVGVGEGDGLVVGDAEAPVYAGGGFGRVNGRGAGSWAAGAGVDGFFICNLGVCGLGVCRVGAFVGGLGGLLEVFAGAGAGVDVAGGDEGSPGVEVEVAAPALGVGAVRASCGGMVAYAWSFRPLEAEPAEVFEHGVDVLGFAAVGVEVFIAEDERAVVGLGSLGGDGEGAGVAGVEVAGGGGRDAASVGHRG